MFFNYNLYRFGDTNSTLLNLVESIDLNQCETLALHTHIHTYTVSIVQQLPQNR